MHWDGSFLPGASYHVPLTFGILCFTASLSSKNIIRTTDVTSNFQVATLKKVDTSEINFNNLTEHIQSIITST